MLKNILHFPKTHLFAAGSLSVLIGSVLMLSPSTEVEANRIAIPLAIETSSVDGQIPVQQQVLASSISQANEAAATSSTPSLPNTSEAVKQATTAGEAPSSLGQQDEGSASDVVVTPAADEAQHREIVADVAAAGDAEQWQSFKVGSGDSLSTIFQRAGVSVQDLNAVLAADKEKRLRKIFPGNTFEFAVADNRLDKVRLKLNKLETIVVKRSDGDRFVAEHQVREPEAHSAFGSGTITSSLYMAGQQAGLSQGMIMELAKIFGYDIDFALDLRDGDQFNVVYEELHLDGKKIGYGNILAASFRNQGQTYMAVRYTDSDGHTSYYRPNGQSLRKAFIRTPVDFARISSHFNLSRRHPILHKIRAHKGTDYAASHGTPIKSAGDGRVIFAGVKGGYGNTLIVQHGQSVTTLYAHMQKFAKGIRVGSRVNQSQIIGYVGSSGLATGPHLHYEFRVNGAPKNPVTVKFPEATPIGRQEMARFKQQTSVHLAQLQTFTESNSVALNAR